MILESLYLSRENYGENKGMVTGRIKFTNNTGSVELRLNSEQCGHILRSLATCAKEQAHEVAGILESQIIEHTRPALEDAS